MKIRFTVFLPLIAFCNLIICNVPVIFIHTNNAYYLKDTLWQAKQFNERVILLGDDENKHHAQNGIEYYPIVNYGKASSYFTSIYEHMSGVPYEFELACFNRWFILEEFMRTNKIPVAFYCDSDVMLYCDISEEYDANFKSYDMSVMQIGYSGGMVSFWNLKSITSFCDFLKRFYEDRPTIAKLVELFLNSPKKPNGYHSCEYNGISTCYNDDAPMLTNFVKDNKNMLSIGNLGQMLNDAVFDPSISYEFYIQPVFPGPTWIHKRYQMKDLSIKVDGNSDISQIKDIILVDGYPYCYNLDLKALIKFKALHFQGHAKKIIADYKICKRN